MNQEIEPEENNIIQLGARKVEHEKENNSKPGDAGRDKEQDVGLDCPTVLLPENKIRSNWNLKTLNIRINLPLIIYFSQGSINIGETMTFFKLVSSTK